MSTEIETLINEVRELKDLVAELIQDEDLLTIDKVIAKTSRSKAVIYQEIAKGNLPRPIKHGHSSLWKKSDVNKLIQKIEANQEAA